MDKFQKKVRSLKPSQIVQAMVDGLRNPCTDIFDMYTFGSFYEDMCVGCTATNAICKLAGIKFTRDTIESVESRADHIGTDERFLTILEYAYNALREGDVYGANYFFGKIGVAEIKHDKSHDNLPRILSKFTDDELKEYERLAEYNREIEKKLP